jgi:hypothetical protein
MVRYSTTCTIQVSAVFRIRTADYSDPALFVHVLQDGNNKYRNFFKILFAYYFWYIDIILQREKVKKKSRNSRNKDFSH